MASYWKTGEGQTVLMGCVFLFVFMAYYMIQSYSANLYGSVLASNMETALYAVFTIACFPVPAVVNKIGTRTSMFVGILGYGVLVGVSLLYYLGFVDSWLVVLGGGINGVGAALLWTGQGRLMLQYSDGNDGGRIFAIFWSIFNLSAVFGGFITFAYFSNESSSGNAPLFVIFLILIIIGGIGALMLAPPEAVQKKSPSQSLDRDERGGMLSGGSGNRVGLNNSAGLGGAVDDDELFNDLTASLTPQQQRNQYLYNNNETIEEGDNETLGDASTINDSNHGEAAAALRRRKRQEEGRSDDTSLFGVSGGKEISDSSWLVEFAATMKLFLDPSMARMAMIFWYTGFNQPYQLVTYGNRYFTNSSLGLLVSLFYTAELVGAFLSATIVDNPHEDNRGKAMRGYTVFFLATTVGYGISFMQELSHSAHESDIPNRDSFSNLLSGGVVMFSWGLSDAMIQSLAYWQLSLFYSDGEDQSRGVGFYKMVQSAGWCVGFAISPASRMKPIYQCIVTAACYVLGLLLLELPSSGNLPASKAMSISSTSQHRRQAGGNGGGFSQDQDPSANRYVTPLPHPSDVDTHYSSRSPPPPPSSSRRPHNPMADSQIGYSPSHEIISPFLHGDD